MRDKKSGDEKDRDEMWGTKSGGRKVESTFHASAESVYCNRILIFVRYYISTPPGQILHVLIFVRINIRPPGGRKSEKIRNLKIL